MPGVKDLGAALGLRSRERGWPDRFMAQSRLTPSLQCAMGCVSVSLCVGGLSPRHSLERPRVGVWGG